MDAIVMWSDIGCPWAHVAVARLRRFRAELDLGDVAIDHRAFPLELVNARATPRRILDAEIPVAQALEPDAGWQVWQRDPFEWPVTMLPALEAVQALKPSQGLAASEALDHALRVAFFGESRCISLLPVVLEVARETAGVDAGDLEAQLRQGAGRAAVIDQWRAATAEGSGIQGSPHVFLPDGQNAHNPGVVMRWSADPGTGFPIIESDDPGEYEKLLACCKRAP